MHHLRILLAALVVAAAVMAARPATVHGQESARPARAQEQAAATEAGTGTEAHDSGWLAVIAKAFNFALLAGVLVYFLRTPLTDYLNGQIVKVREDLVTAAQTRETAMRQLDEIHEKLASLPGEISALKARGTEEIAAERVRIDQAAAAERERVLEHMRREIDTRLRIARRDLIEHASTLAVEVASARIRAAITPDDQARLFDRYTGQIASAEHGPGAGEPETRS